MGVSLNGDTPKSSILIGVSIINHPFWGTTILGNPHMMTIYPTTNQFLERWNTKVQKTGALFERNKSSSKSNQGSFLGGAFPSVPITVKEVKIHNKLTTTKIS